MESTPGNGYPLLAGWVTLPPGTGMEYPPPQLDGVPTPAWTWDGVSPHLNTWDRYPLPTKVGQTHTCENITSRRFIIYIGVNGVCVHDFLTCHRRNLGPETGVSPFSCLQTDTCKNIISLCILHADGKNASTVHISSRIDSLHRISNIDYLTELSFVSDTTSHVGLCLFLESIEHDFIKALMIHTHIQLVT